MNYTPSVQDVVLVTHVEATSSPCNPRYSLHPDLWKYSEHLNIATPHDHDTQLSNGNDDPELNALPEWRQNRMGSNVSSLY